MSDAKLDAIVVGAGHNGLVAACYLARAGLNVQVLERNDYVGGAAVSRQLYENFTYSNCSYVCSLLRPEIMRALELPKYGLQIIPYDGGCTMMSDGGHLAIYDNHDALRREISRHSKRDAEAYDRYSRDVMRQCKFIKPLLLREPPDPASFRPRDIQSLLDLGFRLNRLGSERIYDTLRFWTMSAADFLDEYFESESSRRILPAARSSAPRSGRARPARPTCCCTTTWARSTTPSAPGVLPVAAWVRSARRWPRHCGRVAEQSGPAPGSTGSSSGADAPSVSCCTTVRRSARRWCSRAWTSSAHF